MCVEESGRQDVFRSQNMCYLSVEEGMSLNMRNDN